ncbi:MAG: TetR/AcrR family transcriptional regulator [Acidobacteriota bacterium]|nr:TetR/AcrR family transcriptional regulator [Acidobacteriota bacterium]
MRQKTQNHGEKASHAARQAIESAALALFARKGFDAATTREICANAGVTKPVLYYYFGCKVHLYEDLIVRSFDEVRDQLAQASRRGANTREKLVEMVAALFAHTRSSPERSRLAFHLMFAPPAYKVGIDFSGHWDPVEKTVQRVVEEGVAAGEIQGDAEKITAALLGAQTYYVINFLVSGKPKLDRALASSLVDLLSGGIQAPVAARNNWQNGIRRGQKPRNHRPRMASNNLRRRTPRR